MSIPTGEWGTVGSLDAGVVGFLSNRFDDKLIYTHVPYATAGGGDPAEGDVAFLHYDSQGQPAYAVIWAN